jgi:hypothetical protein
MPALVLIADNDNVICAISSVRDRWEWACGGDFPADHSWASTHPAYATAIRDYPRWIGGIRVPADHIAATLPAPLLRRARSGRHRICASGTLPANCKPRALAGKLALTIAARVPNAATPDVLAPCGDPLLRLPTV